MSLIAIEQLQASSQVAEKALVYAIADEKRYTVDDVVRAPGVKEKVEGKTAELVGLFQGDVMEGVKKGQEWVNANKSWIEGQSELAWAFFSRTLGLSVLTYRRPVIHRRWCFAKTSSYRARPPRFAVF